MIIEYNQSKTITEEERLASLRNSVQRALDEVQEIVSSNGLEKDGAIVDKIKETAQKTQRKVEHVENVAELAGQSVTEMQDRMDSGEFKGEDGQDGQDGFSPIATVTKDGDTATITITDVNGTTTETVSDGQDGTSPTITTSKSGDVTTIYADGVPIGTVTDGSDGSTPNITASKEGGVTTVKVDGTTIATINDGTSVSVSSATKSGGTTTVVLSDGTTLTIDDGEDGSDGTNGLNGYVHIAWANSADGSVDFSTSVSEGKKYLGSYTDNVQADSQLYTDYNWSLIQGADGDDGYSPTATVTKTGDTATITITDINGTTTETVSDGQDGSPGVSVSSVKTQYFLSSSDTTAPSASDPGWSDTPQTFERGKYYWTRDYIDYSDGTHDTSTPVYNQGLTLANEYALSANDAADKARGYANTALTNLGLVEDVVGTLNWIQQHGYYELSQDNSVIANKIYYTVTATAIASPTGNPNLNIYYERSGAGTSADPYIYELSQDTTVDAQKTYYSLSAVSVANPTGNPNENLYYELLLNSALSQYVSSHLSLTDAGLTILNDNSSGSMLMSTDGVTIKNANGVIVGQYGSGATIGALDSQHISIVNGQINFWAGNELDSTNLVAYVSGQELHIPRVVVVQSLQMGNWRWDATMENHLSLNWIGD